MSQPKCQHPHQLAIHAEDMETKKQYWSEEFVPILDEEKKMFAKNHFTRGLTNVFGKSNTDGVFRLFVQDYKSFFDGSRRYKA